MGLLQNHCNSPEQVHNRSFQKHCSLIEPCLKLFRPVASTCWGLSCGMCSKLLSPCMRLCCLRQVCRRASLQELRILLISLPRAALPGADALYELLGLLLLELWGCICTAS